MILISFFSTVTFLIFFFLLTLASIFPLRFCCHNFYSCKCNKPHNSLLFICFRQLIICKETWKQEKIYITSHIYCPHHSSLLCMDPSFHPDHLPSAWRTSFNICCESRSACHRFIRVLFVCKSAYFNLIFWDIFSLVMQFWLARLFVFVSAL